jgi:hypothetical protein
MAVRRYMSSTIIGPKPLLTGLIWLVCCLASVVQADIRILLDVSKSMADNDPNNSRKDAIELLTDSIPNGEFAGLWTFGQYVNMLVPYRKVTDAWRTEVATKIAAQNSPAMRTNLGRALENTAFDFNYASYSGQSHIVLITDGMVDIAPNAEVNAIERERILTQLVPAYERANARIHTVAMSAQADHGLLKQMADQTGGRYQRIDQPSDLTKALSELAAEVYPSTQLALQGKAFTVDPDVRELTVLMYHQAGAVTLISPSGETTSAVMPAEQSWRVGRGFSQVSIIAPEVGQWHVKGALEGDSSIRVRSDINLSWTSPLALTLAKGSQVNLTALLMDSKGQALSSDLGALIEANMQVDGQAVPVVIEQDRIRARFTPAPSSSEASVELTVDGGTFNRLIDLQLRFVDPFVSEVLMTRTGYEWRLYPNQYMGPIQSIDAVASYQLDGDTVTEPFERQQGGYWLWQLPYDVSPDAYQVTLKGSLLDQDSVRLLPAQTIDLMIPPEREAGMAMTPETLDMMAPAADVEPVADIEPIVATEPQVETAPPVNTEPMANTETFVKDPMPEFVEIPSDPAFNESVMDDDLNQDTASADNTSWLRYLLFAVPSLMILGAGFLVYRYFDKKAKGVDSDGDRLDLDGFADLDDLNDMGQDSDLDLSGFDDEDFDEPLLDDKVSDEPLLDDEVSDEPLLDDPVFDDDTSNEPILDADESDNDLPSMDGLADEDLPTPTSAEAPTLAQEDMLDDTPSLEEPAAEAESAEGAEAPDAEAPEAEAPEAEAPEAEAPEAEAPEAEAPDAEAPDAEAPDAEAPEAEAPEAEAPEAEAPDAEAPDAEAPDAEAPVAEAPEADAPEAEAEAPEAEAEAPEAEAEAPEAPAPEEDAPEEEALADIPEPNEEDALFEISSIDDDLAKLELEMDAENDPPAADKPG